MVIITVSRVLISHAIPLLCVGMVPSVKLPTTQFTVRMPSNSFQPQTGHSLYDSAVKTKCFV